MRAKFLMCLSVVLVVAACGTGTPATSTGTTAAQADVHDATTDTENDAVSDSGVDVSCVGIAISAQAHDFDYQCSFLAKCPYSGQCYCGSKCGADKTPHCDPSVCADNDPKCFCGEQCGADKKKCPKYVCDPLDIKDCAPQDDCVFNNAKAPPTCTCTAMPDREPDCWCGQCTGGKAACDAGKCAGKNPAKCIVVPGAEHTQCYCKTCGLLGNEARCFELQCP